MTFDHPLYLVVVAHRVGPYIPESSLASTSKNEVIDDIEDGQFSDVLAVIEVDLSNHTCREVTHDRDFQEALSHHQERAR